MFFTWLFLYTIFSALTGFIYTVIYGFNERACDRWLTKSGIGYSSLPAIILLIALFWPLTIMIPPIVLIYNIGSMIFSTFKSLFSDLFKIMKSKKENKI